MNTKILITGAGGLIGSEAARFYLNKGWTVIGVENNSRMRFFGPEGSTKRMTNDLSRHANYVPVDASIVDRCMMEHVFQHHKPDAIIHCAAQPSHDKAASIPIDDFDTNARGTLVLLETTRNICKDVPFVHVSTNKVYGDNPNKLSLKVNKARTRYICDDPMYQFGIDESMSIDHCTHSLFGVSKTTGDLYAQEYGKYFEMKTGIFRGGCLTGAEHASVALHGYLSYIVKCAVHKKPYTIIGYSGLQVRDQIHSTDVVAAFDAFIESPDCGAVYNLGGEYANSISIIETIALLEHQHSLHLETTYDPTPRIGDHIWYISSMEKFKTRYPFWTQNVGIEEIVERIVSHEKRKLNE